jgi:sugar lactone lactonase YvrE
MIDIEGESIRPLSLRCLAQPSGLALSANEKVLYVSETGENRILRYYQSP